MTLIERDMTLMERDMTLIERDMTLIERDICDSQRHRQFIKLRNLKRDMYFDVLVNS